MITIYDVMCFAVVMQALNTITFGPAAIVICSVWPRKRVRYYQSEEEGYCEERHETTGLVDTERDRPTVLRS